MKPRSHDSTDSGHPPTILKYTILVASFAIAALLLAWNHAASLRRAPSTSGLVTAIEISVSTDDIAPKSENVAPSPRNTSSRHVGPFNVGAPPASNGSSPSALSAEPEAADTDAHEAVAPAPLVKLRLPSGKIVLMPDDRSLVGAFHHAPYWRRAKNRAGWYLNGRRPALLQNVADGVRDVLPPACADLFTAFPGAWASRNQTLWRHLLDTELFHCPGCKWRCEGFRQRLTDFMVSVYRRYVPSLEKQFPFPFVRPSLFASCGGVPYSASPFQVAEGKLNIHEKHFLIMFEESRMMESHLLSNYAFFVTGTDRCPPGFPFPIMCSDVQYDQHLQRNVVGHYLVRPRPLFGTRKPLPGGVKAFADRFDGLQWRGEPTGCPGSFCLPAPLEPLPGELVNNRMVWANYSYPGVAAKWPTLRQGGIDVKISYGGNTGKKVPGLEKTGMYSGKVRRGQFKKYKYGLALDGFVSPDRMVEMMAIGTVLYRQKSMWFQYFHLGLVDGENILIVRDPADLDKKYAQRGPDDLRISNGAQQLIQRATGFSGHDILCPALLMYADSFLSDSEVAALPPNDAFLRQSHFIPWVEFRDLVCPAGNCIQLDYV